MALDITKIKAALPVEEDKGDNVSSIVDGVFAVNTGSTSNQDQEESTKPGSNKSSGFWDTWVGDAIERLNTGGAQLGSGLFGTLDKATIGLEKLGLGTRGGAFKDASNYFKNVAESSRVNSIRNDGKSYSELWKEGNYAGAIGDIALQGIESLPMSISAAAATVAGAPVVGLAGIGAITASDKYDQLDTENPDMGEFAKASNAILTGTAEGLSEMLGAGVSKAWMKTLYKSLGRDKAEQAVKKGLMGQLQRHYKEFGMFYEPVEEGIEEVASQLAENITDKITGADPNRDITDGLQDSFVYGMGGGAYFSAAGVPGFAKRQYDKIKTRKDYNNAKSTFEEEFKDDDRMLDIGSELESATPEEKVAFLEALEPSNQFAKSQKEALFNLVRSDLAYKSLRTPEAINEEKSERRELAVQTEMMNYDNAIAPITAENGMIQQVYINGDKEAPVYITKGSIVASQNENGEFLFDPDKSDQSLYYKDAEGNMQVVSPSQVTGVASLNRLEDSRARYEADIRAQLDMQDQMAEEQRRQEEAQEISNGDDVTYIDPDTGKQLKGKVADIMPGSEYLSIDIGDGNLSTVPKNIAIKSAIQTEPVEGGVEGEILDKTSEKLPINAVIPQEYESKTSEIIDPEPFFADVAEVQEQEPEPVLPVTEKSPIVMREDGTPDFIASGEGNTLDFLLEKYKDKSPHKVEVTKNALESDLKKASAALDKALQNYDNAPIGKEDKAESALLQAQQAYDALKQEADFWKNLDKTIKESNIKPGDQIANGIREAGDPMSGEELAAMMLANGSIRLTRDSYERETGSGKEEGKKMFGLFASSTNGGVNIERAGELLMLADLENGTNFFDQNDPNAGRNAIIEVLSSARTRGDLIDYVKSNREAMAERERQAEYNDYAQWCEENYHLAPEEYEAYESDMRARAESINQNDIDYIDGQIVDEIQQRNEELREIDAILAMQNENGNESDKRNDEGGTGGLPEGSDQLLQDEQSVQVGRTGEAEAEYQGANDSVNIQNGVAQESAPERIKSVSEIANAETAFDMMDRVGLEQKTKLVISEAEQQVDINPTEAQKEAGNYKKGHVKIDGHDITIEQPAGSIRSGKDADGKEWSVTMNNTYGYIRGTEGVDGDHIDIFLSDFPASGNVYVVDQVNGDGVFDEHKVMYGFNSEEEAKAAYLANYSPGWSGLGDITGVSKEEFKKWIGSSKRKTKPFADYKIAQHEKEDKGIRFRRAEEDSEYLGINETNRKFNEELQQQIDGTLPKGHVYQFGKPSAVLQAAGIPDLPIELRSDKLATKASEKYKSNHPFELESVVNLPQAIANPIAVFDSNSSYGSKVILTELKDNKGNSFIVSLSTNVPRGFKRISVNSITSVYPKNDVKGIIGWVSRGDRLKYAEKNKFSSWIAQQMPHATDLAISTRELNVATNIVGSFINPTLDEGKITSSVEELSETLNTPVRIIKDASEITDDNLGAQRQKRSSKGWYDTKTGEVYLVLPNAESMADGQATILHEVVAHKGLRGLLGDSFTPTMETVFDSLPQETQESLMDDFDDKTVAAEEYCAHMAEAMSDPGVIQKICSAIKEALRKIGIGLKITDGDIMYMLWKSKNRLEDNDTAMESMSKILREHNVKKQAKEYDALFRSGNPIEKLPVSTEKKIDIVNDLQSRAERLYEGYVDRMIAVKKLQDLIVEKTGKPIPDYMNVWMYENTLSSRNTYEISKFKERHLSPLTASLKGLVEAGLNERDIDTYVIAKHGLERNEYMRMKAVHEYVDNLKEDDIKEDLYSQIEGRTFSEIVSIADDNLQDLVAKLSNKDYSSLTVIQKELGDQSIDEFISEIESEFKPEIADLWKRIKAVNEFSLKKWFDSGMINRATYEKIKGMYKNYVPLRGFDETMAHDVYEYYTTEENPFNNPLKSAGGRTSRAESPFPHLISMAESSIVGGNKNLMKLHLYRLAQHDMTSVDPTGKLSITKQWYVYDGVDKDGVEKWKPSVPEYADDIEQYRKNIEKHSEEMALLESERKATRNPSKLKVAYILLPAEANEHAIGVKLNGEFYQVLVHGNPKVAQAVEGLNDEARTNNKFVKAVAWANRQMAANFTTKNPAFVASNLTRDLIWSTTALSVKEGGKYRNRFMRNIPKASGALIRKLNGKQDLSNPIDIMLNEFLENGGRTGYTALYSVEKYKKDIQNSIKTGKWAKTKRGYNVVLDFMQLPNEWAEDLSRFSTYMTSREEGRTILKAVADAKEVTVNFNRKGSGKYGAGVFRGLFLFFNAAVQSLNNAYGLTLKNPAGMATALGGFSIAGTIIPLILSMLGSDDEREKYNGLPDYVRKNNLCIPLGWCGVDGFLKIPLPIELRAFYGIGDAVYRALTGDDESIEALYAISLGLLDLLPLNPAGGTSNFTPAAFKPIVESYITNEDFTGKPIAKITPFNEYDPEYQKVYRSTSVVPVKVSEYLNMLAGGDEAIRKFETYKTLSGSDLLNPASIEHLFEAYLGGMFTTLNQSFKTFVGAPAGLNDFSWRNVPVLNRFYDTGEVDGTMMKVNEKYFDYLDEMKEAQNVYRKYESMIDTSPALESTKYYEKLSKYEEGREWRRAEFIADYAEQISDYMDEIKESTDEKRKDELQKEINLLKKEMVESLKNGRVPD